MKNIHNKGDILVVTRTQQTGCGIRYLKEYSIVKVAIDCPDWNETIRVYRNKREDEDGRTMPCSIYDVRPATDTEKEMYLNGVYFVESVNAG